MSESSLQNQNPVLMQKANYIYIQIQIRLKNILANSHSHRAVIGLSGGSGSGKTSIAALLKENLERDGIGCYVLAGDDYPRRLPRYNDAERLRIYREYGLRGLVDGGVYTPERFSFVQQWQKLGEDADFGHAGENPWFWNYLDGGRKGLAAYLGSPKELDFQKVEAVVSSFKAGMNEIWLRKMGREETEIWYENTDFHGIQVMLIEWTHANSSCFQGVDLSVYLDSTPQETLARRMERNRDSGVDSPFTAMVLEIEQQQLKKQVKKVDFVFSDAVDNGPMLNAYPDSLGGKLSQITRLLASPEWLGAFQSFYILPSLYHSDLDRGFSVIDYGLNEEYAGRQDLEELNRLGIGLKLDFILNHASVNSPQFQDLLKNGENSEYRDFFIDWNQFWEGCGEMTPEGYIYPRNDLIKDMFFRKPGLPLLMVPFPDGEKVPYWNTFYQEIREDGSFLGQMDLNIHSPLVWSFYADTLKTLAGYGAKIVRLDAFAYADKRPGAKNFLNEPGIWEVLTRVQALADKYDLTLLPEIHAGYDEKIYQVLADKGYMAYDFFLPGLILDALERGNGETLLQWAEELFTKKIRTVNMLGCHDGIPLLDLKGLLPQERIEELIRTVVSRGGYVKNLHGQKNVYYQVNAAYYSALGEDDDKLLLARALQLFMPGKPQIWYLDLFAGKNDHAAVERAGAGGHKEINRTNLTLEQMEERMKLPVVTKQLELLRFRNTFPAFGFNAVMEASLSETDKNLLTISWENRGCRAYLGADLSDFSFRIRAFDAEGERIVMENRPGTR